MRTRLEFPYPSATQVGSMDFLLGVIAVTLHRRGVRNVRVYSAFRRYHRVDRVAPLDKVEIGSVDTPVVAGMEDVIAVVLRVVGDPFQTGVRGVAGEQTFPIAHDRQDDQASVVQFSCIARRYALSRADYFEAHAVGTPPRLVKVLLAIRHVKFGASSLEVVEVSIKFIPFLDRYTIISSTPLIWAVDQMVNGITLVFEIAKPRVMVFMLVGDEDATEFFICWQQIRVILDVVTIDQERCA